MKIQDHQTVISDALIYKDAWVSTAVDAGNTIDDAIEQALTILMGKHVRSMNIIHVIYAPLQFHNPDSTRFVVTVFAESE
jgi:hypothetical protein